MRKKLSLIMIVKNEEARLGNLLSDVQGLADEIIVADTGSDDRTREIAAAAGAQVFNIPWEDDFSKARNAALARAKGDFILWLDADDRVSAEDAKHIRSTVDKAGKNDVFTVEIINTSKEG
ncbi:MAG: glycosyltransferase, partial [Fibrobacterota bacterium]